MGELSSKITDVTIRYKQKPFIEQVKKDQYIFAEHLEYCEDARYRNVCSTDDYQKLAAFMDSTNDHAQCRVMASSEVDRDLIEVAMGLTSESGEFANEIRKYIFQGHDVNPKHLAEELGDISWFLAMAAKMLGYDLSDIFRMNIEKLIKRYPEGFDPKRSVNRE